MKLNLAEEIQGCSITPLDVKIVYIKAKWEYLVPIEIKASLTEARIAYQLEIKR